MWWVAAALAQDPAAECGKTSIGKLTQAPAPAVIVLGERKGTLPDLARARKVVKKLAARGEPVTLALQAVKPEGQPVLDQVSAGTLPVDQAAGKLDWENTWGFPFEVYAPLLELEGVKTVGIGQAYTLRPSEEAVPLPPAYITVLADPMGDNPVPPEMESGFAEFVAWADHRMARAAVEAWDGRGYLVILVDRYHVEGGLGVQWQAQRLTEAPVSAALLADAGSRCYRGDQLL
jgi:uncharacterized iron-regulated protein